MNLKQRPDLTVREAADETLILDRRSGNIHRLNVTANFIWNHCNGEASIEDISTAVGARFNAPKAMVTQDIQQTICRFQELGLLEEHKSEV